MWKVEIPASGNTTPYTRLRGLRLPMVWRLYRYRTFFGAMVWEIRESRIMPCFILHRTEWRTARITLALGAPKFQRYTLQWIFFSTVWTVGRAPPTELERGENEKHTRYDSSDAFSFCFPFRVMDCFGNGRVARWYFDKLLRLRLFGRYIVDDCEGEPSLWQVFKLSV